jgi:hypothetical protein
MAPFTKALLFPFVSGSAIVGASIACVGCTFLAIIGVGKATIQIVKDMYKEAG